MMEVPVRGTATEGMRLCGRFMERLMLLPLAQWWDVAADAPAELEADVAQALATALETADALALWSMRDDLATVLYRFEGAEGRLLRGRASVPHLRLITERAACSLLMRATLAVVVFDNIYGPFAVAIPVASL
jgi:hypothetical protein